MLVTTAQDAPELSRSRIGRRVRALRLQQRRRLRDVALDAECSESLLSRVENGLVTPSLTTLHRLARTLRVTVAALLQGDGETTCTIYGPDERPRTALAGTAEGDGSSAESLVPYAIDRRLEAMIVSLPAEGALCGPFVHEGEEVGLVLDGALELHVGGVRHVVPAQSSFFFASSSSHSYRATGGARCRVMWMNTPPTF